MHILFTIIFSFCCASCKYYNRPPTLSEAVSSYIKEVIPPAMSESKLRRYSDPISISRAPLPLVVVCLCRVVTCFITLPNQQWAGLLLFSRRYNFNGVEQFKLTANINYFIRPFYATPQRPGRLLNRGRDLLPNFQTFDKYSVRRDVC